MCSLEEHMSYCTLYGNIIDIRYESAGFALPNFSILFGV